MFIVLPTRITIKGEKPGRNSFLYNFFYSKLTMPAGCLFVVGFLTSSSETKLHRGWFPRPTSDNLPKKVVASLNKLDASSGWATVYK